MLKHTKTKEFAGPSEEDIAMVGRLFEQYGSDFDKRAEVCGLDPAAIWKHQPGDARSFAIQFLVGDYSIDRAARAQADLRDNLEENLPEAMDKLRRADTRKQIGRIGRLVFRAAIANPEVEVKAVNDPFVDLFGLTCRRSPY